MIFDPNNGWNEILSSECKKEYFKHLCGFLESEYAAKTVYPPEKELFNAFKLTPPEKIKAVILGQDPYINKGQAHGLAFSVRNGKLPPSLANIYRELESDLGIKRESGDLSDWAENGVLLLNAVLSVESGKSGSHKNKGWEKFTDCAVKYAAECGRPLVFILWGGMAAKKEPLLKNPAHPAHLIIKSAHPSPLSAYGGFFGSRPFSRTNHFLFRNNVEPINWRQKTIITT